jgi:hypothetical protein
MYIVIFEEVGSHKSLECPDSWKRECDDGLLELIDISDPDDPKFYHEGGWHPMMLAIP